METKKQKQILLEHGYQPMQKFGGRAFLCRKKNSEKLYLIKVAYDKDEIKRIEDEFRNLTAIYEFLKQNKITFHSLIIPPIIDYLVTPSSYLLTLNYYDNPFPYSEMEPEKYVYGGRLVPLRLIPYLIKALAELQILKDIKLLNLPHPTLSGLDQQAQKNMLQPVFQLDDLIQKADQLKKNIKPDDLTKNVVLVNGDFYFRNFILWQEKLVLIDWESAKVSFPEDPAAYNWMLAFNNPLWQEKWSREVSKQPWFNKSLWEFMLIYHTINHLAFWYPKREQAPVSLNLFKLLDNIRTLL